jgi:hypothetical protein
MFLGDGHGGAAAHHATAVVRAPRRNEDLVSVRRESTFLRYTANTQALQEILQFLYSECCIRNKAVKPKDVVETCR